MKICPKHKLPLLQVCLFIDCKKQRMICYKCIPDHELHSEQIIELENISTNNKNMNEEETTFSSILSNKNNKQGVSPHNKSSEFNGSPFILNNLANLNLNSCSQNSSNSNLKKNSDQNSFYLIQEFQKGDQTSEVIEQAKIQKQKEPFSFLASQMEKQPQQIPNTQSRKQTQKCAFVIKEESVDDDEESFSCKAENGLNNNQRQPNFFNSHRDKYFKESAQTKILGKDVDSQLSRQKGNSQKNITQLLSQASTISPSIESVDQSMVDTQGNPSNYYPQYPFFRPCHPFQNPFLLNNRFDQNSQMPYPPSSHFSLGYSPNQINPPFSHMYNQQYSFNNMPPYIPQPQMAFQPGFNHYKKQNSMLYDQESKESFQTMSKSNSYEKYFPEKDQLHIEKEPKTSKLNEKINFITSDESLQHLDLYDFCQNGVAFQEMIKQNENIQKICLYLRSLNDIKLSLCAKIERLKSNFLQQIQMKEEDFSYAFLANTFTQNNNQVEEKLKHYFNKMKYLSSFFENNKLTYNPQAASKQKLSQIESELEKMLQFTIDKIDQEKINQEKLKQQNQSDPFKDYPEYEELIQYYIDQPANINAIKDKINLYSQYQLEFDGATKGNPGRSGAGFIIKDLYTDSKLLEYSVEVGTKTINQSEYLALIYGMYTCFKLGDSEVVLKHMQGVYQCRSLQLREYYNLTKILDELFHFKDYILVKKELNTEADALANQALN